MRARYLGHAQVARTRATERLSPLGDVSFHLTSLNSGAIDAARLQWETVYYDWHEILRRFNEPDRFDLALWADHRCLALGLATTRRTAIWLDIIEGDPSPTSPLGGARLTIVLEACAHYAQLLGKDELRLTAKNEQLAAFYEAVHGFERAKHSNNAIYWRRRI